MNATNLLPELSDKLFHDNPTSLYLVEFLSAVLLQLIEIFLPDLQRVGRDANYDEVSRDPRLS